MMCTIGCYYGMKHGNIVKNEILILPNQLNTANHRYKAALRRK